MGGVGETIQGVGGASLGVHALGLDYYSEYAGSYNFNHTGGVDSDALMPSLTALFVGWVGAPGEVLNSVDYTPGSAHGLDDIVAHMGAVPMLSAGGQVVLLIAFVGTAATLLRRRNGIVG